MREALLLSPVPRPAVAYVGAASGDNPVFRVMVSKMLRSAGASEVKLAPLCRGRSDRLAAMRVIEERPVVFLSGGDVEEGRRVLEEKGMAGFLRDQYRDGKLFIGMSAGSILLAKGWIRWPDESADARAELFPCLGLAELYCDTHDEGDGWEELKALVRLAPAGSACYGIPSGAALVSGPDGEVWALGGPLHSFGCEQGRVVRLRDLLPESSRVTRRARPAE